LKLEEHHVIPLWFSRFGIECDKIKILPTLEHHEKVHRWLNDNEWQYYYGHRLHQSPQSQENTTLMYSIEIMIICSVIYFCKRFLMFNKS
jgi:hypothetical protein